MGRSYREKIDGIEFFVGEINAKKCFNINQLCRELENSFQQSLSVKENCIDAMYDLSWLDERNFKVIVKNFHSIKNENIKKLLMVELNNYSKYWEEKKQRELKDKEYNFVVEYR